eukprot:scaffold58674_cov44-Attheya_sp.AAC.4
MGQIPGHLFNANNDLQAVIARIAAHGGLLFAIHQSTKSATVCVSADVDSIDEIEAASDTVTSHPRIHASWHGGPAAPERHLTTFSMVSSV